MPGLIFLGSCCTHVDCSQAAVPVVAEATDGKLDYIIANAGLISDFSPYRTFATM